MEGTTASLSGRLVPGESKESVQVFDVPAEMTDPKLVLSHGWTPGVAVIGEAKLPGRPVIFRLAP